jgi:hypothetical protein
MGRDLLKVPERNNDPNGMFCPACLFFLCVGCLRDSLVVVVVFAAPASLGWVVESGGDRKL